MGAPPSSPPTPNGPVQRDDNAQFKANLLLAYFETSRQELVSRVSQRDSAVLLFLVAATAIFGVAFGNVTIPAILFAIAPLGLGAAVIYAQHNTLIGQLAHYSGVEITEQAKEILKGTWPKSWENSESLNDTELSVVVSRGRGLKERWRRYREHRRRYRDIPDIYRHRLFAISLLIVIPGIAGAAMGTLMIGQLWALLCGLVGAFIALRARTFLIDSALHRSVLRDKVAKSGDETEREQRDTTGGGEAKPKA